MTATHKPSHQEIRHAIIMESKDYEGTLTDAELIEKLNISRTTYYYCKKALRERNGDD